MTTGTATRFRISNCNLLYNGSHFWNNTFVEFRQNCSSATKTFEKLHTKVHIQGRKEKKRKKKALDVEGRRGRKNLISILSLTFFIFSSFSYRTFG